MLRNSSFIFVFDLDNTLVETNQANNMAYKEAIEKYIGRNVEIKRQRFTRTDLPIQFPHLSPSQIRKIVELKEELYRNYLCHTVLNKELFKTLKLLHTIGHETVLLTECRKSRAVQICSYHKLCPYFSYHFYKEDYNDRNKYTFLNEHVTHCSNVVLFENENAEIEKACEYGIPESQILTIKV